MYQFPDPLVLQENIKQFIFGMAYVSEAILFHGPSSATLQINHCATAIRFLLFRGIGEGEPRGGEDPLDFHSIEIRARNGLDRANALIVGSSMGGRVEGHRNERIKGGMGRS